MLSVGLTGGIGSGKSTAARIFMSLGIPVYDADSRAKALMNSDARLIEKLKETFGQDTYADGRLDNKRLAAKVFTDKRSLSLLNSIVHPAVMLDIGAWQMECGNIGVPYVVLEAAILFEAGFDSLMDYSVTISAPLGERVQRAAMRDCADAERIRERAANQMSDAERESRADFVLHNAETDMLLPQMLALHEKLLAISAGTAHDQR